MILQGVFFCMFCLCRLMTFWWIWIITIRPKICSSLCIAKEVISVMARPSWSMLKKCGCDKMSRSSSWALSAPCCFFFVHECLELKWVCPIFKKRVEVTAVVYLVLNLHLPSVSDHYSYPSFVKLLNRWRWFGLDYLWSEAIWVRSLSFESTWWMKSVIYKWTQSPLLSLSCIFVLKVRSRRPCIAPRNVIEHPLAPFGLWMG